MATPVCDFNKNGFCKFKLNSRKQHVMQICCKTNCEIKTCSLRHPRICRYHRDIGFCKFGEWCLFKHEGIAKGSIEIKNISDKIIDIEKVIAEKNKQIDSLEKILEDHKTGQFN